MKRESLKAAYEAATAATIELERCRKLISELHYRAEEVENSKFLLDNIGRWADPSDDAHEVLFARVKAAEKALEDCLANNAVVAIKACIHSVEGEAFKAKQFIEGA